MQYVQFRMSHIFFSIKYASQWGYVTSHKSLFNMHLSIIDYMFVAGAMNSDIVLLPAAY